MKKQKEHLEALAHFIRENRSSESNFDKLHEMLVAESNAAAEGYAGKLYETLEKHAAAYKQKKDKGAGAWPEFENFVTHFEKAVTEALHVS
jgi:hypothetical protein